MDRIKDWPEKSETRDEPSMLWKHHFSLFSETKFVPCHFSGIKDLGAADLLFEPS